MSWTIFNLHDIHRGHTSQPKRGPSAASELLQILPDGGTCNKPEKETMHVAATTACNAILQSVDNAATTACNVRRAYSPWPLSMETITIRTIQGYASSRKWDQEAAVRRAVKRLMGVQNVHGGPTCIQKGLCSWINRIRTSTLVATPRSRLSRTPQIGSLMSI